MLQLCIFLPIGIVVAAWGVQVVLVASGDEARKS